jgi:NADH-quinone oxidoreductase subunit G
LRITARKDVYGEVESFICNTCRFEKKKTADWVLEHPTHISDASVISSNHYETFQPLPVIQENLQLQAANKVELEKTSKF